MTLSLCCLIVVGCLPDGNSALMLAAARLRHIAGTKWGTRRYMNMEHLTELKKECAAEQAAKTKNVGSVA